jgi:uncharacterized protein (UPF0305 family)
MAVAVRPLISLHCQFFIPRYRHQIISYSIPFYMKMKHNRINDLLRKQSTESTDLSLSFIPEMASLVCGSVGWLLDQDHASVEQLV